MNIYFRFFFVSVDYLTLSHSFSEYFSSECSKEIRTYLLNIYAISIPLNNKIETMLRLLRN